MNRSHGLFVAGAEAETVPASIPDISTAGNNLSSISLICFWLAQAANIFASNTLTSSFFITCPFINLLFGGCNTKPAISDNATSLNSPLAET